MKSKPTSMLWELIGRLANTMLTLRISGEMGVGKQAVARLICRHYPNPGVRFLKIDCRRLRSAAAPCPLTQLKHVLNAPQCTVLYLENVECASKEIQHRLLKLVNTSYPSDPPWVFASSLQPLERYVRDDQFSIGLFRALDTIHIMLPPLRCISEKIPQMLSWFVSQYSPHLPQRNLPLPAMGQMERLIDYHWPRNWLQLQDYARHAIEKMDWNVSLSSSMSHKALPEKLNDIAVINILSMAKLGIQKEKVMEQMIAASRLDEIGLLDLAIFNEAVNQIAEYMDHEDEN